MLRLRPSALRPTLPAALAAAAVGLRRFAPGRQRRGASPRSTAAAAPRPARGRGEGRPASREEQCGRRPRPLAALGDRCAALRCRDRIPAWAGRGEGDARRPARGFAAARLRRRARHVASLRASSARPRRQVPLRARGRDPGLCSPGACRGRGRPAPRGPPGWPYAGTRRSPTRTLRAPGRWSAGPEAKGGNFGLRLDRGSATSCSSQCHLAGCQPARSSLASRRRGRTDL